MSILYLTDQNSSLHITGERFILHKQNQTIMDVPYFHIEKIFIFGNIQITSQAFRFMLEHNIPCSFFSNRGKYYGIVHGSDSGNVFLRISQYERYIDYQYRMNTAKIIVENKIQTQINTLEKYLAHHHSDNIKSILTKLHNLKHRLDEAVKIEQLTGFEGKASMLYFSCFNELLKNSIAFTGRNRRPPKDPVNSLLSLSYSLVTNELISQLRGSGFDCYIGFLHDLSYNRPSLALDLVEEFRAMLDQFVIKLFNLKIMHETDFILENGGVFLTDDSRKHFFQKYETFINEHHVRSMIKKQVYKMLKAIQINERYQPYEGEDNCIL